MRQSPPPKPTSQERPQSPTSIPIRRDTMLSARNDATPKLFVIEQELGAGGHGTALLCKVNRPTTPETDSNQPQYPEKVVVKVITDFHQLPSKAKLQAVQEVGALRRLTHPNIVKYVDAWLEVGPQSPYFNCLCVGMHYADQGDLAQRIHLAQRRGDLLPPTLVMNVAIQLLSALTYAHAQKVVHRDIKPSNVFLTGQSIDHTNVLVGDFGIAKNLLSSAQHMLTRIGTPLYLSPEIVSCKPYTAKTDIFSLGVTLYELVALRRPFEASDSAIRSHNHNKIIDSVYESVIRHDPIPKLRELLLQHPKYPIILLDVIRLALKKDPTSRPSAAQLLRLLPGGTTEIERLGLNAPLSPLCQNNASRQSESPVRPSSPVFRPRTPSSSPIRRAPTREAPRNSPVRSPIKPKGTDPFASKDSTQNCSPQPAPQLRAVVASHVAKAAQTDGGKRKLLLTSLQALAKELNIMRKTEVTSSVGLEALAILEVTFQMFKHEGKEATLKRLEMTLPLIFTDSLQFPNHPGFTLLVNDVLEQMKDVYFS